MAYIQQVAMSTMMRTIDITARKEKENSEITGENNHHIIQILVIGYHEHFSFIFGLLYLEP